MNLNATEVACSELANMAKHLPPFSPGEIGRVQSFDGNIIEATGVRAPIGTICSIGVANGSMAEIIGFRHDRALLMSYVNNTQLTPLSPVHILKREQFIAVGDELLGRVIDANAVPLDGREKIVSQTHWPLQNPPANPLLKGSVRERFDCGIRAINGLLTMGRGQRIGIIAGSGVGKSVLLGMMAGFCVADIVVIALIGERAREVTDFVFTKISDARRQKTIVVAVPANYPAVLRVRAAHSATAIAEYFSSIGKNVLLILDSLTRVAHAQREIGLTLGEQPTAKGYPPSVISLLPNIIERAGVNSASGGSITAIYTILADGDNTISDPVVDTARAILDGHIILSRKIAERGLYPAIDISASISRVMADIVSPEHLSSAARYRRLSSLYADNIDLVMMGAYQKGNDPELDVAISLQPRIAAYLNQSVSDTISYDDSLTRLNSDFLLPA